MSVYGQVEDVKKFLEDPAAYAAANPVAAAPAAGGGGGEAKKEEKKVGSRVRPRILEGKRMENGQFQKAFHPQGLFSHRFRASRALCLSFRSL